VPGIIIPSTPQWQAEAGISAPLGVQLIADENAYWRDGDILTLGVTGTITAPNPNGSLATAAGPLDIFITRGQSASANIPAQDWFGYVTYEGAANIESQISNMFVISTPFGFVPTVSVSATGAPAGATDFGVFLGVTPASIVRQSAAAGVALGATFTGTNPLTNHAGTVRAATGASTNLVGLADCDSDAIFNAAPGGSQATGKRGLFGATQSYAPGWDNSGFAAPVIKLQRGLFVFNLLQPYFAALNGSTAGIAIDTTNTFITGGTKFFIVDNTQTACLTILRRLVSKPATEQDGDIGARVLVRFTPAALA
jgi:hypothetical protein